MNYRSMPPTRSANSGNNNIVPVLGVDADAGGRTRTLMIVSRPLTQQADNDNEANLVSFSSVVSIVMIDRL